MSVTDRDEHVYQAKLAEQAERYDEMVLAMKKVAELNVELTVEERNLLSVAYKNVIGARRASWRIISSIEQKEGEKQDDNKKTLIQDYKETIEAHLEDTCNEILTLLTDKLIPRAQKEGEEMVFYLKMKGDYYRYLSEFSTGDKRQTMATNSLAAYQEASDVAAKSLSVTDPVYLGLALNFSVFYYEILDKPQNACRLAQTAFENASTELGDLDPKHQKDAGLILQLLKDNLTLWTADLDEQTGDDGVKLQDMDN